MNNTWDKYFHHMCEAAATKSPCLSRQIGALLVRDHSIVATGYNGPPRGEPHCGKDRWNADTELNTIYYNDVDHVQISHEGSKTICPRRLLGYESGTHLELCPAQHAETNCIANAARLGVTVLGTTLYMNCIIPCKNCFGMLINAGVVEIVVDDKLHYDKHTQQLIDNPAIKIREFNL